MSRRIISIDRIDFIESVNAIKELQATKEPGQKVEWLWNEKGEFTGHVWGFNCSYSESDLERNGDYKLSEDDEAILIQELIP